MPDAAATGVTSHVQWAMDQPKRLIDYVYDDLAATVVWPRLRKLTELLSRPEEMLPLVQVALAAQRAKALPQNPDLAFCYDMLNKVSRR